MPTEGPFNRPEGQTAIGVCAFLSQVRPQVGLQDDASDKGCLTTVCRRNLQSFIRTPMSKSLRTGSKTGGSFVGMPHSNAAKLKNGDISDLGFLSLNLYLMYNGIMCLFRWLICGRKSKPRCPARAPITCACESNAGRALPSSSARGHPFKFRGSRHDKSRILERPWEKTKATSHSAEGLRIRRQFQNKFSLHLVFVGFICAYSFNLFDVV